MELPWMIRRSGQDMSQSSHKASQSLVYYQYTILIFYVLVPSDGGYNTTNNILVSTHQVPSNGVYGP